MNYILFFLVGSIVLIVVPAWVFARKAGIAMDRAAGNKCLKCGYDLRASPFQCPECGEKPLKRLDLKKLKQSWNGTMMQSPSVTDAELTTVEHETTSSNEARLLISRLEQRGIAACRTDSDLKGQPFLVLFNVCVREIDKAAAERIVEEFELV